MGRGQIINVLYTRIRRLDIILRAIGNQWRVFLACKFHEELNIRKIHWRMASRQVEGTLGQDW